jgi:tetratricopeptide (TPR) repeat protein
LKTALSTIFFVVVIALSARATDDGTIWKQLYRDGTKALEKNDYAKAKTLLSEAAERAENFDPDDKRFADTYRRLAFVSVQLRDYRSAVLAYGRLLYGDQRRLGTNDLRFAGDLLQAVEVDGFAKNFAEGQENLDRATAIVMKSRGNQSVAMGICYFSRGELELQEGHQPIAEENFQKAIQLLDATTTKLHFFSPEMRVKESYFDPPRTMLANVFNACGICQCQEKKYAEAEDSFGQCIQIFEREYGRGSVRLVNPLSNLADTYLQDGRLPEAEAAARRALKLVPAVEQSHPAVKVTRHLLAKILTAEGKESTAPE